VTAPSYRATLSAYLAPQRGRVIRLAAVLLGSIGLQLLIPVLLARFIDEATRGAEVGLLVSGAILYLAAGVVTQVLDAVATYLSALVGWVATNRLREDLGSHLLSLEMAFHTSTTPGEIIERVDGDVTTLSNFLSRFAVRILGAGLLLVGSVGVVWAREATMGVAILAYVLAVLAFLIRMRRLAVAAAEEERETSALLYGFVEERLAGIEDIRANGAGAFTMHRFVPVMQDFYRRTVAAWMKRTVVWISASAAFWTGDVLALAMGVWLVRADTITVGSAYLLFQYVQLARRPVEQIAQELNDLQKAAGGLVRIDRLRAVTSGMNAGGEAELPGGALSVEFDRVGFSYEAQVVLTDVSFRLEPGTVLGLLGRTGGGKTTITRLLARLYDPTTGVVRLGGFDLREVSPASLRRAVGVVTQDVQLFRASVKDNLVFFDRGRTEDEILAVLDRSGLGEWVRGVGLATLLGAGGSGLSAGEQQLLAFARVFLQSPGVVILDEPSSRLDPATEALLAAATARLFSGRTVVIVAHRLETVRLADEIMVVEAGRVVEHDRRDTLAADPASRYGRLLERGLV
jgi:ABC-type multidrug transport system fused ATPase/permease subunit